MAIQLNVSKLLFAFGDKELTYRLSCAPATDAIKVVVEGGFEIALANSAEKKFGKELLLLPDTSQQVHRIEREICVRIKGKQAGKISHSFHHQPHSLPVWLSLELQQQAVVPPKTNTPPQPYLKFLPSELNFGRCRTEQPKRMELKVEIQGVKQCEIETTPPFSISTDGKQFSQKILWHFDGKGSTRLVFVQLNASEAGSYNQPLLFRAESLAPKQIVLRAQCRDTPRYKWLSAINGLYLLIGIFAVWGMMGVIFSKGRVQSPAAPSPPTSSHKQIPLTSTNPNDPSCKPSLYQKLKEKTTVIRYGCATADCDTAFIREILTHAAGSKAFHFVNLQAFMPNTDCGEFVAAAFKADKADVIFSDQNCELINVDASHSLCPDLSSQKCIFLVPCGNSEGLLKVLNKEIRRRKAKTVMNE